MDWSISPGSSCLSCLLGWNPSLSSFNSKFHLLLTEVSVQGAPVSLACWAGIPVYLVFIVYFIYHRLKYQSRELLSPLVTGLESQFTVLVWIVHFIYHKLKYHFREFLSPLLAGCESHLANCTSELLPISSGRTCLPRCWVGNPDDLVVY